MVQVSLSTSTDFDGDLNALVEDQGTALTVRFDLDEPAPASGLKVYVDSDVEQIINRLDLPAAIANPQFENLNLFATQTNFDNSGLAVEIAGGATFATITLDIFDNPEPDTFLPETFDGLVEAVFSLVTADQIAPEDQTSITGVGDYTIAPDAATSTVFFADEASQLPGTPPPPPTNGYDEAVSGDISDDPNNPVGLALVEGTTQLSASTGGGDQEYVTVTVPDGFQLESILLEDYSQSDVSFIGVQEGATFTEPLDNSAELGEFLGYSLFGISAVGTDILDNIGNGSNGPGFGGQGFSGPLPAGTYTFAIQQLDGPSDYTLAFNVSAATVTPPPTGDLPVVSFEAIPSTISEEGSAEDRLLRLVFTVDGAIPEGGLVVNFDNLFGITDQLDSQDDRAAFNNLAFAGFDVPNNRIFVRLDANEASIDLPVINDLIEETTTFDFILAEGDGYVVDPDQNATLFTITDDNGGPGVGPTIGLSVSETNLAEGDTLTVNFTVDGTIPPDGIDVLVQSDESVSGPLGQFELSNLDALQLSGVSNLRPGDDRGQSFIATITEANASISLNVFDDIVAEEPLEIPFALMNGELYEVDSAASEVTLTISDEPQPVGPIVGLTLDKTDAVEGESITLSFAVEGEIPAGGLTVLVNDVNSAQSGLRSLTEFDVANIELSDGIADFPTPADGDSGFFVTLTESTASITLPVLDDNADEDEANESFTFEVIDGEAYEVDADANSVTLNIADIGDGNPPTGDPIVSFEVTPNTFSEEDPNNLVEWKWTVTGDFPEDGLVVNLNTSGGGFAFAFTEQFAASPSSEFINSDIVGFDPETGELSIRLDAPEASFKLYFVNDILEEGVQEFEFLLVDGNGYTVDASMNGGIFTITDDNGGPGVGPTVALSVSETDLAEGDTFTVTFNVAGDIPTEGVQVLVQSDVPGSLGQFDLADLGNITTTGIAGLPTVGDGGGGSFFVTITEPTATISLNVFDDIIEEDPLDITFSLANGEVYEVDPAAASTTLTISDEIQTTEIKPTVGISVDQTTLVEGGDAVTLTISVDGVIPGGGIPILINDLASVGNQSRSLTEFDIGNVTTTGIADFPIPADGDSGFFVTVMEPTATITLAAFDEGADEDEAMEQFTFELIDGEAYEVAPDASSVTLNIVDAADSNGDGGNGPVVSVDVIGGTFSDEDALVTPNLVESGSGTPILSIVVSADGPIPEDGLVVNINTDLADITEFISGANFVPLSFGGDVIGAIYDDSGTATGLQLRLESQNAVVNFPGVGLAVTDPQTVNFFVEAGAGYTADADMAAITVYDTLDQVPAVTSIPEVSMSLADSGPFTEGSDAVTVNFALAGDIPAEGVLVYVSNNAFAGLVDFDLLNAQVTGGSFPAPDGNAGGFYFKITEPTASLTLAVRADEAIEGLEQVPLALQTLPGYTIAAGAGEISVLLQDDASSIVQVSVEASSDVLVETEGTAAVHTFNLSAPPADGQLTVTVEAPGLTELDILDLQVENGGISAIRPGGFDLVIWGQSATVTLPVVDDGVSEGLEEIAFSVAAGDGYQIDPEAGSASFQIVDTVEQTPATDAESNDTIATAIATGLGPDNSSVSIDGAISFSFSNREVDQTEDVDMYSFAMAAGDTIRIDADSAVFDSGLDTVLRIFDAGGNEVAGSDDDFAPDELFAPGRRDSYVEFTATEAGNYYVGVSSFGNGFFDFFLDDDGNPTNAPYDPNVAGSGTGRSFGDYTLNLKLNEEFTADATDIPASTGEGPTVSLSASPATYDSDDNLTASALVQFVEDGASILTVGLTTEGDISEDGIEVFLTSSLDLSTAFNTGAPFSPGGAEVLGAVFDDAGTPVGLRINLTSNTAVLNLNLDSPDAAPTDGVETVTFTLEPSAGYQVSDDSTFSTEIYDTLADVPVMPNVPTVGVAVSETALVESEGNLTTLTFTLDGPPPAEGVLINVDSGVRAALGEFDVFNAEITGGDFPSPNFRASGFFFRITEQTATITLAAFDETTNDQIPAEDALEGIEEFTFTVQPGVGYAIAPDASAVTVTIADNPDSVPLPGDDGDDSDDGDEMTPMEMELNDTIADANAIELPLDGSSIVIEGEIGTTRATRNLIDRSEDVDMYAFDLEAGQTLILDVDGGGTGDAGVEGSLLDNILRIFDAEGNELAIVENAGAPDEVFQANGDAYIEFTAPETGTYYAGISNLGNNFYDPNVAGSGSGWTFNDRFEPGPYRLEATLATTPTLPTVSVSLPEVVSEADDAPILTAVFTVAGEIPADGLVVAIGGDAGFLLDPANRIADNNRLFEIVPEGGITADGFGPNGELLVRLFASEVSFGLPIFDDILEEPDTDYTFTLLEGDGYLVDPDSALQTVTFTDGVPGGVGPTVSLSVDQTDLAEGDEFTVNFEVEGDIPEGGLTVFVDGPPAALSEFNIFGDDGIDPDTDIVGLAGLPEPDNDAGGFFATITENQASITLSVFEDGPGEGLETLTFEVVNGEEYEVSETNGSVTINIDDAPSDLPVVSVSTTTPELTEELQPQLEITLTVEGEIPDDGQGVVVTFGGDGVSKLFVPRLLDERTQPVFDPTDGVVPIGFTGTEVILGLLVPEVTVTAGLFDDLVEEERDVLNFEILPGDGYEVGDGTVSIGIEDGPSATPGEGPTVSLSVSETELAEGEEFTVNITVDESTGAIPDGGLELFIDSGPTDIGEFVIFGEDGIDPETDLVGIDDFPLQGDRNGGFFVTVVEPEASIALTVFDDGPNEGSETLEFSLADGEIYEVAPDAQDVTITIEDGGEDAEYEVESGVTSVFLDFELLEAAAGITLVGADSDATPESRPAFLPPFQVGFEITEETDFSFAPVGFVPVGGSIEHDGTITLGLGGAEVTVGEFSIGFDPARASDVASGFFVADTLDDALGLEALFDLGIPATAAVSGIDGDDLNLGDADLLLAPEVANALGNADLAGADVGDARVDALVSLSAGGPPNPGTSTDGDDELVGTDGNDFLDGLRGDDTYTGGAGADQFVFDLAQGVDTITDFEVGIDQLSLGGLTPDGVKFFELGNDTLVLTNSNELLGVVQGVTSLDNTVFA